MKEQSPKTLQALIRSITSPKSVQNKGHRRNEAPNDKGCELLYCEGCLEPDKAMESDTVDEEEETLIF